MVFWFDTGVLRLIMNVTKSSNFLKNPDILRVLNNIEIIISDEYLDFSQYTVQEWNIWPVEWLDLQFRQLVLTFTPQVYRFRDNLKSFYNARNFLIRKTLFDSREKFSSDSNEFPSFFLSEFSFTNIHESQDCRGRRRAFL